MLITATWRKSTKSGPYSDNCVEVRMADNVIEVRNSKRPDAGTATFDREEWLAFTEGVKNREFEV